MIANVNTVQFTVSKEFASTIKLAMSAMVKRSRVTVLESALLTFKRDSVTIESANMEVFYSNAVAVDGLDVEQEFSIVLHRDVLKQIKVKSTVTVSETFITINGITFKPINTPDDFPQTPQLDENAHHVELDASYFRDIVTCSVSAGTSEVRPVLTSIHHNGNHITSTDGHRLFTATRAVEFPAPFNLSASVANLLQKTFDTNAHLDYDKNYAVYSVNGVKVITRLVDGNYPDTQRIIPTLHKTTVNITDVAQWIRACESIVSVYKSAAKRDCNYMMCMEIQPAQVEVSATCETTHATYRDTLTTGLDVYGESLTIHCNAQYLLDALKQIDRSASLGFNGPSSPFLVTSATSDRIAVVSPIFKR